jgi:hypothetical protein
VAGAYIRTRITLAYDTPHGRTVAKAVKVRIGWLEGQKSERAPAYIRHRVLECFLPALAGGEALLLIL